MSFTSASFCLNLATGDDRVISTVPSVSLQDKCREMEKDNQRKVTSGSSNKLQTYSS